MKYLLLILFLVALFVGVSSAWAQDSASDFSQCRDGSSIVRCETYDCPRGDSNNDGVCSLTDVGARLTDARNDSFCANPISGCGQVNYYSATNNSACSIRVEETVNNCDLYNAGTPTFSSRPSPTPTPEASATDAVCKALNVDEFEGSAPLTVQLSADATNAVSYQFTFGDSTGSANTKVQSTSRVSHTYTKAGVYTASVSVKGDGGEYTSSNTCKKVITVREGKALGGSTEKTLPKTGSPLWIGLAIAVSGICGAYLFERYRTI